MRLGLNQDQQQVPRSASDMPPPIAALTTKEIPYDYVAKFTLRGERGHRVQDVINVSIEGAFVAVTIGYSFIPPPPKAIILAGTNDGTTERTIDFKYSIVDSGSGRELQNQPIHNIAGLGEATGKRPFRPLAKPMLFMPRSTIRIEVQEISVGDLYGYEDAITKQRVGAELFIVLHGYKILGYGTGLS